MALAQDYVMGDPHAVSNAVKFQKPPEGWDIACDHKGNYAPRFGVHVLDLPEVSTVRTSRFEATVAAWRIKGIWDLNKRKEFTNDTPPLLHSTNLWGDCEE